MEKIRYTLLFLRVSRDAQVRRQKIFSGKWIFRFRIDDLEICNTQPCGSRPVPTETGPLTLNGNVPPLSHRLIRIYLAWSSHFRLMDEASIEPTARFKTYNSLKFLQDFPLKINEWETPFTIDQSQTPYAMMQLLLCPHICNWSVDGYFEQKYFHIN